MIPFNPLNENTGKAYKINAVNALCRYYKAMGYYRYTDEIDEMIGQACDNKQRNLKIITASPNFTDEIKEFLIQHYQSLSFDISIEKFSDEDGVINYDIIIKW